MVFVAILAAGLLGSTGTNAVEDTSPSSCVACHTDEKTLVANLTKEKPKKSSHTAGAG